MWPLAKPEACVPVRVCKMLCAEKHLRMCACAHVRMCFYVRRIVRVCAYVYVRRVRVYSECLVLGHGDTEWSGDMISSRHGVRRIYDVVHNHGTSIRHFCN